MDRPKLDVVWPAVAGKDRCRVEQRVATDSREPAAGSAFEEDQHVVPLEAVVCELLNAVERAK